MKMEIFYLLTRGINKEKRKRWDLSFAIDKKTDVLDEFSLSLTLSILSYFRKHAWVEEVILK